MEDERTIVRSLHAKDQRLRDPVADGDVRVEEHLVREDEVASGKRCAVLPARFRAADTW